MEANIANKIANDDFAPEHFVRPEPTPLCGKCELGGLQNTQIQTAIWRETGLVVIRNIPAMVCPTCGEEYVGRQTARSLDRMCDNDFGTRTSNDQMTVPVFDFVQEPID